MVNLDELRCVLGFLTKINAKIKKKKKKKNGNACVKYHVVIKCVKLFVFLNVDF